MIDPQNKMKPDGVNTNRLSLLNVLGAFLLVLGLIIIIGEVVIATVSRADEAWPIIILVGLALGITAIGVLARHRLHSSVLKAAGLFFILMGLPVFAYAAIADAYRVILWLCTGVFIVLPGILVFAWGIKRSRQDANYAILSRFARRTGHACLITCGLSVGLSAFLAVSSQQIGSKGCRLILAHDDVLKRLATTSWTLTDPEFREFEKKIDEYLDSEPELWRLRIIGADQRYLNSSIDDVKLKDGRVVNVAQAWWLSGFKPDEFWSAISARQRLEHDLEKLGYPTPPLKINRESLLREIEIVHMTTLSNYADAVGTLQTYAVASAMFAVLLLILTAVFYFHGIHMGRKSAITAFRVSCPRCATVNDPGEAFCANCGYALGEQIITEDNVPAT